MVDDVWSSIRLSLPALSSGCGALQRSQTIFKDGAQVALTSGGLFVVAGDLLLEELRSVAPRHRPGAYTRTLFGST